MIPNLLRGAALALTFFAVAAPAAPAAQMEFRPDLLERIQALRPVYPVQAGIAVAGAAYRVEEADADARPVAISRSADGSGLPANVLLVSGVIEKGDAARLEDMLRSPYMIYIAFDSPGGSFSEGFEIGNKIIFNLGSSDPNLGGVYVLKDMQCLSACAVAFSLAQESRFVEGGAKLGFHMPYLAGEKGEQQGAAQELLNLAYDITGAFNRLLQSGINPPKLLTSMLGHRTADSFFILDGGIETWNYGFTPVESGIWSKPAYVYGVDTDLAGTLCNFLFLYGRAFRAPYEEEYGMFEEREDREIPLLTDFVKQTGKRSFARGGAGGFSCEVRVNADDTLGLAVWRGERDCLEPAAGERSQEEWCAVAPRQTSLVTVGMLSDALGCTGGVFDPKAALYGFFAKRDVNVRRSASLDGELYGSLKKGDQLPVVGCEITGDHQSVWYRLEGKTSDGYVSARFLRGQGNVYRFFEEHRQAEQ